MDKLSGGFYNLNYDGDEFTYPQKDFEDYIRAKPFREFAKEYGSTPSHLAHRYALSIDKISSIILGVKNRRDLQECLDAEFMGPLTQDEIDHINKVLLVDRDLQEDNTGI